MTIRPATIRTARPEDLPTLNAIYDAAMTGTDAGCDVSPRPAEERRAWWEAHQAPPHPILALEQEGVVVGYAALSLWHEGVLYTRTVEASIYLASSARGQGWGTRLLRALLDEAARLGHHAVVARVWSGNAGSLALCRRCGFQEVGVQRQVGFRRGTWEDCVILQQILPERPEEV